MISELKKHLNLLKKDETEKYKREISSYLRSNADGGGFGGKHLSDLRDICINHLIKFKDGVVEVVTNYIKLSNGKVNQLEICEISLNYLKDSIKEYDGLRYSEIASSSGGISDSMKKELDLSYQFKLVLKELESDINLACYEAVKACGKNKFERFKNMALDNLFIAVLVLVVSPILSLWKLYELLMMLVEK